MNPPVFVWFCRHDLTREMRSVLRAYTVITFQTPRPNLPAQSWTGIQSETIKVSPSPFPAVIMAVTPYDWRDEFVRLVIQDSGGKTEVVRTIMTVGQPLVWSGRWWKFYMDRESGNVKKTENWTPLDYKARK